MSSNPTTTTTTQILYKIIQEKVQEEESISVKIFGTFAFFGLLAAWMFSGTMFQDVENGLYGPASIVIWSYVTTIVSLCFILLINNIIDPENSLSIGTNLSGVIAIFLMIWIITINIKHFKKINMNVVPKDYPSYSGWSYLFLLLQSVFVYITSGYKSKTSGNGNGNVNVNAIHKQKDDAIMTFQILSYIIMFLTFVLINIQQIILDRFSVDVL